MSLRIRTFSAVRWTAFAMIGKALFQFLQMIILARILSPSDFGLMALVLSVIMFALLFVDMGISNAIIHYQDISPFERSSLYWLNVLVGILLMTFLMAASSWIAIFYHESRLQPLLFLISPYFLIVALGQQLKVLAEKELLFNRLALCEITSVALGFLVMIILATNDYGVYSLVIGFLTNAVGFTLLAWMYLSNGWRPHLRLHLNEIRKFISYGSFMIGNNLVNSINSSAAIFMGGYLLESSTLGVFSLPHNLALNVASVINPIVTRVGLPVLAKSQDNLVLLKSVYLKTMQMTSSINFPIYVALFAFSPEVVRVMFGTQWHESIPLLRLLAVWGMLRSVGNPVGSLIFAVGRADLAFKWNLGWMFIIMPSVWFGLQYGALGLSIVLVILVIVGQIPNWFFLVRPLCGARFIEYFAQMIKPLIASLIAAGIGYFSVVSITGDIWRLFIGCGLGLLAYLILSYWLNREWLIAIFDLFLMRRK